MRHRVVQRVVCRLLVTGEQHLLYFLPPTRDHERLERHVVALGRPLTTVRVQSPLSKRGTPAWRSATTSCSPKIWRGQRVVLLGAGEQPIIPYDAEPDPEVAELFPERRSYAYQKVAASVARRRSGAKVPAAGR